MDKVCVEDVCCVSEGTSDGSAVVSGGLADCSSSFGSWHGKVRGMSMKSAAVASVQTAEGAVALLISSPCFRFPAS